MNRRPLKPYGSGKTVETIVVVCGSILAVLSFLTLIEYATGWQLGIDEILVADHGTADEEHPGRPGIGSAICLGLAGLAQLALVSENPASVASLDRGPGRGCC